MLAGVLVLPAALGFGGATKGTVAVSGPQAAAAARQAVARQRAFDVELTVRRVSDDAAARRLVRDGDADVAVLAGGRALLAAQDADDSVVERRAGGLAGRARRAAAAAAARRDRGRVERAPTARGSRSSRS